MCLGYVTDTWCNISSKLTESPEQTRQDNHLPQVVGQVCRGTDTGEDRDPARTGTTNHRQPSSTSRLVLFVCTTTAMRSRRRRSTGYRTRSLKNPSSSRPSLTRLVCTRDLCAGGRLQGLRLSDTHRSGGWGSNTSRSRGHHE